MVKVVGTTTYAGGVERAAGSFVPEQISESLALIASDNANQINEGLSKLARTTFNNPLAKQAAGSARAIQTVVTAMQQFQSDDSIQLSGCHVLRNIVFGCEPNQQLVKEQDAIPAVIRVMEQHLSNAAVQAEACWALVVFCSNHDENIAIAKPHGAVIERVLAAHSTQSDIRNKAIFLKALLS